MRQTKFLVVACAILLLQFYAVYCSPSSCGDGAEEPEHPPMTPTPKPTDTLNHSRTPSSETSLSSSRSSSRMSGTSSSGSSGEENHFGSQVCDCSVESLLEPISSSSDGSTSFDDSSSLSFDGATSDIARQLYLRYEAGDVVAEMELESVPAIVQTRLDNVSLAFEDLPGLLQRAVVWDSGFAVNSDNRAVKIWTLDNRSMSDIAVSAQEFAATGCKALSCSESNDTTAQIYANCSRGSVDVLATAKCVVENFDSEEGSNEVLWAIGGNHNAVPDIRVVKNDGIDTTECGCNGTFYSIHTSAINVEAGSGRCPINDGPVSLAFPCFGSDTIPEPIAARVTTPPSSDWVTSWIWQYKESVARESSGLTSQGSSSTATGSENGSEDGLSWWWLLLILLLILLVIIAAIVACRHCHRLSRMNAINDNTTYIFVGGRMWAVQDENNGRGVTYWLRFVNWCRKTFIFFN